MARKTRKVRPKIEHHHMLLRLETKLCPHRADESRVRSMLQDIVRDLNMRALDVPRTYYVESPASESGLTAFVPIETSHIAFHFWNHPDADILHHPDSRCLLQMDVYTCGRLTRAQIARVLERFSCYEPTHANVDVFNRKKNLHIDISSRWDLRTLHSWDAWRTTL